MIKFSALLSFTLAFLVYAGVADITYTMAFMPLMLILSLSFSLVVIVAFFIFILWSKGRRVEFSKAAKAENHPLMKDIMFHWNKDKEDYASIRSKLKDRGKHER